MIKANKALFALKNIGSSKDLHNKGNLKNHSLFISGLSETPHPNNKIIFEYEKNNKHLKQAFNRNTEENIPTKKTTAILYKRRNNKDDNNYSKIYDTIDNTGKTINLNSQINHNIANYKINSVTYRTTKKNDDSKQNNITERHTFHKYNQTYINKGYAITYVVPKKMESRFIDDTYAYAYDFNEKKDFSIDNSNLLLNRLKRNETIDKKLRILTIYSSTMGQHFFYNPQKSSINNPNLSKNISSYMQNLNKSKDYTEQKTMRKSASNSGIRITRERKNKIKMGSKLNYKDRRLESRTVRIKKAEIINDLNKDNNNDNKNEQNTDKKNEEKNLEKNKEETNIENKDENNEKNKNEKDEKKKNEEENELYSEENYDEYTNEKEEEEDKDESEEKNGQITEEENDESKEEGRISEDIISRDDKDNNIINNEEEKVDEKDKIEEKNEEEKNNQKEKEEEKKDEKEDINKEEKKDEDVTTKISNIEDIIKDENNKIENKKEEKEGKEDVNNEEKSLELEKINIDNQNEDKKEEKENNGEEKRDKEEKLDKDKEDDKEKEKELKHKSKIIKGKKKRKQKKIIIIKKKDNELKIKENNEKDENKELIKQEKTIKEEIIQTYEIKDNQNNVNTINGKKENKSIIASDIKPNTSRLSKQMDIKKHIRQKQRELDQNKYKSNNVQKIKDLKISLLTNNKIRELMKSKLTDIKIDPNSKATIYYYTSASNQNTDIKKEIFNINNSYDYDNKDNKYKYTEDDKQSISNSNQATQINNYNYLETRNIKNIKKDNLTLHSNGNEIYNQYDNIAYVESKAEDFKPYVSKYPELVFKKRGLGLKQYNLKSKKSSSKNFKKEKDKKDNKNIVFVNMNKNDALNENKNKKNDLNNNKLNIYEDSKKFSSYFGDSNNNVYFEIKQFNEKDKKGDNINQKGKDSNRKVINKRGIQQKLGNFNCYGVQSEALYIPKDN